MRRSSQQVEEKFSLHELAVEDARHGHQRPKLEEYGSCFVPRPARRRAERRRADAGRGRHLRRPRLHRVGPAQYQARVRRRAAALRAGTGAASSRPRLRALRADGRGRRSLFPGARGPRRGGGEHRGANLQRPEHARADRGALRPTPQAGAARPRHRPVARGDRQAPRRPGAAHLCRAARLLSRRLRSPDSPEAVDREPARNGDDGDVGEPVAHHHQRERGHQAPRLLRGARRRADDDRGRLRHELRPTCRSSGGGGAIPLRSGRWCLSISISSIASEKPDGSDDSTRGPSRITRPSGASSTRSWPPPIPMRILRRPPGTRRCRCGSPVGDGPSSPKWTAPWWGPT